MQRPGAVWGVRPLIYKSRAIGFFDGLKAGPCVSVCKIMCVVEKRFV